jgi:hypothetical protein
MMLLLLGTVHTLVVSSAEAARRNTRSLRDLLSSVIGQVFWIMGNMNRVVSVTFPHKTTKKDKC